MFEKPENWESLVAVADTIDAYKGITANIFPDNRTNKAYMIVWESYTRDVMKMHPRIEKEVWLHYCETFRKLESCRPILFPSWGDLGKAVVKELLSLLL